MQETLRSVESGPLKLDGLLLAEEGELPVGAALMMSQADGVALVWPPIISCRAQDTDKTETALMTRLCELIDQAGSRLAQCLLSPDDAFEIGLLTKHDFQHAADIFFLARALTNVDRDGTSIDEDLDHETYCDNNADTFSSVLEQTYVDSLDCPFLNGFRSGSEAIKSHQLSGQFDPAGWRLYRCGSDVIGLLLLNEHPEQDAIELVYFGVLPEFRGRGMGRKVLKDGIQAAALTGRSVVFLAVDCGNTYANALYNELGFTELARRRIMLRRSPQLARK